jgi:hypothetical protein
MFQSFVFVVTLSLSICNILFTQVSQREALSPALAEAMFQGTQEKFQEADPASGSAQLSQNILLFGLW